MKDRFYGVLFGQAVGDALGAPIEFEPVNERLEMKSLKDAQKYEVEPGIWTDDTSMTLCLLDSLLEKKSFNPSDQLAKYNAWYKDGYMTPTGDCLDVGKTVLRAIDRYNRFRTVKSTNQREEGNGSLMRTGAVALYQPKLEQLQETMELAVKCSYVTHGSKLAADCCSYYTKLIVHALNATPKSQLLSTGMTDGHQFDQRLIDGIKKYHTTDFDELKKNDTGTALNTLKLALKAFNETDNFHDGLVLVVNNSKDSDTAGAVYGMLAGAYYGITNVPWVKDLVNTAVIMEVLDRAWLEQSGDTETEVEVIDMTQ